MKTAYNLIIEKVMPKLKGYTTDITKHDKQLLENYSGRFLYGTRDTGTNLLKMDLQPRAYLSDCFFNFLDTNDKEKAIQKIERTLIDEVLIWLYYSNTDFYFYDGTELRTITKARAISMFEAHVMNMGTKLRTDNNFYLDTVKLTGKN